MLLAGRIPVDQLMRHERTAFMARCLMIEDGDPHIDLGGINEVVTIYPAPKMTEGIVMEID